MLRRDFLAVLPAAAVLPGAVVPPTARGRLARRDSFLGMHFDLHPGPDDMTLGRDLTDDMVERFLVRVKPDYVQYDCKGHPGYLGYESKVSRPAGRIVKDSLEIWRRVTEKHGVSLFIHFSGVWDGLAVVEHPEWARLDADGKPDAKVTSTFGPYVDERMILQLKEAAARYRLDGAWVDGECWAVKPDYSPAVAKAFQEKTGITPLPKAPGERGWQEFLEFNREQFRSYVRHYVEVLHAAQPGFQIASNWLYSSFVPERPTLAVDYISGDFLGNASISTARLDARYMGQTGKPWDLMAWGFQNSSEPGAVTPIYKPAVMLQQEASVVLAQGGGFQAYFVPTRSGWIDDQRIETMGKVADFCRARQSFSHKSEPVPQVGVIFSGRTLYRTSNRMFGGWGSQVNAARGMVDALVECGYSVDVIPDWKLEEVMARYPLLVLPEWSDVGPEVKASLVTYVTGGGRLLLAGAANVTLWAAELGLALRGEPHQQMAHLTGVETMGTANGMWQDVEAKGATVLEWRYPAMDTRREGLAAATLSVLGKGEVVAVAGPLGAVFAVTHAPAIRQFVGRLARRVFRPAFRLEAPPVLEAALRRKGGKTYLHLCNAQAMQVASEYAATDYIPAAGPVRVLFRERPRRAVLVPEGRALQVERRGEEWALTVASIAIHSAIAVDL
ncbi:MAG: hypothetical protein ABI693_24570 [Bryobacteraceae bacterium]